ncbi:dynamin family protein [Paenibacillus sp. OAS669]|uniref:dynamin family protein n=1 Tax=Paenibacillus sp. OAS669 TaxID=2663821 RepID=UPI001789EAAB|nr:dynamin family protein [Paenibacillus sp. OAS669]MBE1441705.1 putative GTPase [Paenibacillus sp. OAS669]
MSNLTVVGDKMESTIRALLEQVEKEKDAENGKKIKQLLQKAQSGSFYIAFCGHFSAGKSSLINKLCGHQLLPSSPIPTSANIVSITNGESGARVVHRAADDAEPKVQTVPLADLGAYCKNGEDIETVNLRYPIPFLGEHAALLDTPGIDSTDDAHQLATESALHLADVVFYVMDYNHVQSEINFAFTKKMKEWGKPLYLLINQVDKHRDQELSFETYRAGVKEAFANWHIQPDGILYTSVKVSNHPHSEWGKLDWLLGKLIESHKPLSALSLEKSAKHLASEHARKMAERNEPVKEQLRAQLAADEESGNAQQQWADLSKELAEAEAKPEALRTSLRKEIGHILDNANITPAITRDLAHEYLQSRKPGFKVGFFAGAAKTAKEIERRLHAFHSDFSNQIATQMERHLQQTLSKAADATALLHADQVREIVERLHVEIEPQWFAEQVNESAGFGGDYTLNYSKQIASEVKLLYRKCAFDLVDELTEAMAAALKPKIGGLQEQLDALEGRLGSLRELERLAAAEEAYAAQLQAPLAALHASAPQLPDPAAAVAVAAGAPAAPQAASDAGAAASDALAAVAVAANRNARTGAAPLTQGGHRARLREAAAKLADGARELAGLSQLQSICRSLQEKAERLENNRFTIALFGAFSAGKSSFANALIGERILPVSPNPTTAAINKIMPPEPENGWPHGTAKVKMKSMERLTDDVRYSLEVLGIPTTDFQDALKAIHRLSADQVSAKGKPHYTFLKAVERGWSAVEQDIGGELKVDAEQFGHYAADESKSCFVDLIELYYSNPLTDQGIVLVDTPGADSINARHTGVAFNYIKNADAILFVTYYNHAFSHADKEFLLQLGRVKDSFELDKMFFIVNAADLASSAEELEGVVAHVESNLQQHGIRHPRIYPLSSYYALEGKLQRSDETIQASGIAAFETDFVRFSLEELTEIAIRSGHGDLNRAADVLKQWIVSAQSDESERQSKARAIRQALDEAVQLLQGISTEPEERELRKEIEELLYYVKQREVFRFGELFNLAFNPSVFAEEGKDVKSLIQAAWDDLRRMISFDLSQEILATTLRVENSINKTAKKRREQWMQSFGADLADFQPSAYEPHTFTPLEETEPFGAQEAVTVKWLSGFYKNAKHFFEGDGKQKLRTELEARLNDPLTGYVQRQSDRLELFYQEQLQAWYKDMSAQLQQELTEYAEGQLAALEMQIDIGELHQKLGRLQQILG